MGNVISGGAVWLVCADQVGSLPHAELESGELACGARLTGPAGRYACLDAASFLALPRVCSACRKILSGADPLETVGRPCKACAATGRLTWLSEDGSCRRAAAHA